MAPITADEIRSLARASRIHIEEDEVPALTADISAVLEYVTVLQTVVQESEKNVAALPKNENRMRDDHVQTFPAQTLLKQAPVLEGDYYVVPRILK